jgi:hypothetical protein
MSTEGETLQVSVLPYRCSICAPLVTRQVGQKLGVPLPLLTCSPSAWPSRLLYRRGRKSRRDLWTTLYYVLDTTGYKHARRIWNTYCFSTVKMDTPTRLKVTFYIHCLPCLKLLTNFKSSRYNGAITRYVLRCVDISQLCFFQMLTAPSPSQTFLFDLVTITISGAG